MSKDVIEFPAWTMSGVALDYASLFDRHMESPIVYFYMSFLTCLGSYFGDKVKLETEIDVQPRMYTTLLGATANPRKSTAIWSAIKEIKSVFNDLQDCHGVNSAEGLQRVFTSKGRNLLLVLDEFKHFIGKASIKGSVLLEAVTSLFSKNRSEGHKGEKSIVIDDGYLSILSACTLATYERIWSPQFIDIGFPNRLFIVPASATKCIPLPRPVPDSAKDIIREKLFKIKARIGTGIVIPMSFNSRSVYDDWYGNMRKSIHNERIDEYAMRLMLLYAISEMRYEITDDIAQKVITICDWQRKMRILFDPIDADNHVATMEEKIRRRLSIRPHTDRELKQGTAAYRAGLRTYNWALKNLKNDFEIALDNGFWSLTTDNQ